MSRDREKQIVKYIVRTARARWGNAWHTISEQMRYDALRSAILDSILQRDDESVATVAQLTKLTDAVMFEGEKP